jgi:tryptophan 2,3-dioxygenase
MTVMDIQTRKLKAIEYLIGLHDEKVLKKIESTIVEIQRQQTIKIDVKPMTQEQLIERAKRSTADYLSGRYKTQDQLEKESKNW